MTKDVVLSVIVPVYNVAPFLNCCIDSLLNQGISEDEYEIILVDDGSTDSSAEIIQAYIPRHKCLRYVHQSNAGVSAARNNGLRHATGKYIAFVDSDDFVIPNAFNLLCDKMTEENADMVIFGYYLVGENESSCDGGAETIKIIPNTSGNPRIATTVWRSIVRRELIEANNIRFIEGMKYGEDMWFAFLTAMCVDPNKQLLCEDKVYCYRQREGSAMHQEIEKVAPQRMKDMLFLVDGYGDFLKEHLELSEWKQREIRTRRYIAAAAVCLDAVRNPVTDPFFMQKTLREKGVYPYPFLWALLKRKVSLGTMLQALLGNRIVFYLFAQTRLLQGR